MSTPARIQGFPPLLGSAPKVLILGSMPSVRSLAEQQYYGHPRNRFWPLMAELLGFSAGLDYALRCQRVTAAGIAIWDVLAACERPGSLDAAIRRESEIANPIDELLGATPSLRCIAFNGGAARQLYLRHLGPPSVESLALPSTSPANAAWRPADLHREWSALLRFLQP